MRRLLVRAGVAVALVFGLSACSDGGGGDPGKAITATISTGVAAGPVTSERRAFCGEAMYRIGEAFNAGRPADRG